MTRAPNVKMEVQNLSVRYGGTQALKDVSLGVEGGQVTALIGPSGCGKSTLLRVLNRMSELLPDARHTGAVRLDGQDIFAPEVDVTALRRRVGLVFARPNPFAMSVYENVAYGLRIAGERARSVLDGRVEEALRAAALWDEVSDRLGRAATELTTGQQQRLCVARALAVGPEVLLMDEPTSVLDPVATAKVEELISALRGRYTLVIVTHNMQQASRLSDHTALFVEGELVEIGETARIFTRPRQRRTEDYITGRFG
ncbi:phosphate ABC transporter ATP-binding protein PstB [Myxococcota bacterium]|nr:phosphate ABC transporter ATP-binding protein PstB [Myxococcota bacterium]